MSTIKKLAIGETAVFKVKGVTVDKAGKWPDYVFADAASDTVYSAPKQAIDRQLERIKLSPIELVGEWMQLERAPNKDDAAKSWWNLSLSAPYEAEKPSKRAEAGLAPSSDTPHGTGRAPNALEVFEQGHDAPHPSDDDAPNGVAFALPTNDERQTKIDRAYAHAWSVASEAQGDAGNPESMQSGAATLLIAYQKAGVC